MSTVNDSKTTSALEGYNSQGNYVKSIKLEGPDSMTATILTLGGRLVNLRLADGRSLVIPITSLAEVESDRAYINVAVGRVANRIRDGRVKGIPLAAPALQLNENGVTHIHGGWRAWDKRIFAVRERGPNWAVLFLYSPDGDQGYAGAVDVTVRYELRGGGALYVELATRNVGEVDTITNMTLHPYFDITGSEGRTEGAVLGWEVHAPNCSRHLVLDGINVPTGEIAHVENTHLDFRSPRLLGTSLATGAGFDNFLALDNYDPEKAQRAHLVTVTAVDQKVRMVVESNQPGFQIYSADGFDGKGSLGFAKKGSLAIEPSGYIDAGNHSNFPSIMLKPGHCKVQSTMFTFTQWSS